MGKLVTQSAIPYDTRGLHSTVSNATVQSQMNFLMCQEFFPKNNRLKVEK